ncbi:hypothetical protein GCM10009841_12450 [Microlunatus panaciterrae]|uniref:DUF222 domain-containing protein n=1 Tax=Microlunatus panaciterrae TaxID=400768 RepID=A0ABS2RM94_9ACTN|nr:hypothetical protein [Microlunatus panaciterrae]MBM7799803.1 hypothetical protein [Microlunatus panaciterrae]
MLEHTGVERLDAGSLAALVSRTHRALVDAEAAMLELAALWGHTFPAAHSTDPEAAPAVEQDAALEFGTLMQAGLMAAQNMIADALDLEHRLPRVWLRVRKGEVRAWKAREIAKQTRQLDRAGAEYVDTAVHRYLTALNWTRFQHLLAAKIIEADPRQAEARAKAAEAERFVRTGRSSDHGLKTLYARAQAGEVIWFVAMVDRIATILGDRGDPDSEDVRRSRAIGILANPALALRLLASQCGGSADSPASDPESSVPGPALCPPAGADDHGHPEQRPFATADGEPPQDDPWPCADPWPAQARRLAEQIWAWRQTATEEPRPTEPPERPDDDAAAAARSAADRRARPEQAARAVDAVVRSDVPLHRLLPKAVLYVHLQQEVMTGEVAGCARLEGVGPVTLEQVRRFLGQSCRVRVQPVIDLESVKAVDAWEIPAWMRERVRLRNPADIFPYAAGTGRHVDCDHSTPYLPMSRGGPPGQTSELRLGPLSRRHHNAKTRRSWRVRQPSAGLFVWRSRHGFVYLVDVDGTHDLGRVVSPMRSGAPPTRD